MITLAAEWLGCEVEALTLVAMVHELAHGYTQLGADIDGRRWPAREYLPAEPALVEGLAQYYTERTLGRLRRDCPGALRVFLAMLPRQPPSYRVHARWISDHSPEAVRQSMLEVRRGREGTLGAFEARLAGRSNNCGRSGRGPRRSLPCPTLPPRSFSGEGAPVDPTLRFIAQRRETQPGGGRRVFGTGGGKGACPSSRARSSPPARWATGCGPYWISA
ncbi:MAG: hypothetical protein ACKOET_14610 [Verrucomicrobiota bacterium]